MATVSVESWSGNKILGVLSRGGVFSALDWREMVLASGPPIEAKAIQKSRHLAAYDSESQMALKTSYGRYCSLQSISSEDTVTWSVFGAYSPKPWLHDLLSLVFDSVPSSEWSLDFWKRLPHPETGTPYGPEADVILKSSCGWSCAVEAKWLNTDVDKRQGRYRNKTQLEMRSAEFSNQLVIAPNRSRYLPARNADSTFCRYFTAVGDLYEPKPETNQLGAIKAITWEQVEKLLLTRKEIEATSIASYLGWRLGKLPQAGSAAERSP